MKILRTILFALILFSFFKGYAQNDSLDTGFASFYHDWFYGKRTSSGEILGAQKLTCAHRSLPFGTRLKVTNLDNHKTAIVTVNDRGPFVRGRIIDVTQSVARKLDFVAQGQVKVKIEMLTCEANPDSIYLTADSVRPFYKLQATETGFEAFSVKIASYLSERKTFDVVRELKQKWNEDVFVQTVPYKDGTMYRIFAGKFANRQHAEKLYEKLKDFYADCYVTKLAPTKQ